MTKRTITRKARQAGREEAVRRAGELRHLARDVRINDDIGSHFTLWMNGEQRVEWWPGAQHWRHNDHDLYGNCDEFIAWLNNSGEGQQHG
ncbi:MAG: hypothetical protein ABNH26_08635 [Celeribacter sp.]